MSAERPPRQRGERQCSALAVIVGAQQDKDVFQGNDDDQGPQDQRQYPEHRILGDGSAVLGRNHRFAKRVKRAGADVAIDDTDAPNDQSE